MRSPQNLLFSRLNNPTFSAFPTLSCSHFPLADASMWRHPGRVRLSQPPFRWQMPHESRSHLLWGSCELSGLLRAAESCEVQGKCKGFVEGGRWREGPARWLECCARSFVEHFSPVSVSMGAKWNPSRMVAGCTLLLVTFYQSMSRRWNSGPIFQQVICLELYTTCLFCIQQIFGSDTDYTWKMYSAKFSISSGSWGACSALGLTMVTGTFLHCSI